MKKLLVAFAIVASAAIAHAGAASWSVMNIQGASGNAPEGWLVQVFDAATAYSYDAVKAGTLVALDSQLSAKSSATATTVKAGGSGVGSYGASEEVSWYAVIYDASTVAGASNYIVSDVKTVKVSAAGAVPAMAFGNMALTTTANLFRNATWTSTQPTPTPEPTSAMLLVLGLAGLALRRKQK